MPMRVHIYDRLHRSFLLLVCCLALAVPPARAFQVADGMALLRQDMPVNYCAVTFDDGPGPYTAALLDLLAARGITATFFVLGHNAERRPDMIRRMLADGHEVASHGYSHANMRRLKPEAQFLEIKKTLDVLHALGAEVRYFRPPYGRYTPETVAKAQALGLTIMLWSLDSQDWKRSVSRLDGWRSVSPTVQRSFAGLRGVLLFHDTHKRTVDDMADILDVLVAGGCDRFVTVSEYMAEAPREEGYRLSTQAPNEGRGEIPPPADARDMRPSGTGMRTQAAHPVQIRQSAGMRTYAAHGGPGDPSPAAVPEALMTGIVTGGQSADVRGRIPRLLSDPGMLLPAHRPIRSKQDMKRGESNPG